MPADAHDKKASTKGPIIGQVLRFALEHGQYFLVLVVRFSGGCLLRVVPGSCQYMCDCDTQIRQWTRITRPHLRGRTCFGVAIGEANRLTDRSEIHMEMSYILM